MQLITWYIKCHWKGIRREQGLSFFALNYNTNHQPDSRTTCPFLAIHRYSKERYHPALQTSLDMQLLHLLMLVLASLAIASPIPADDGSSPWSH